MSVLIKGMEIPDHCINCPFMISRDGDDCILQSEEANSNFKNWEQMRDNCPLVKLPEKHGRLIDGDALWDAMSKYNDNEGAKFPFGYDDTLIHIDSACFVIENAPTVIEAEGE